MIIVKVPIENSHDSNGCRKAGNEIINKIPNKFINESKKIIEKPNLLFEEIHLDNANLSQANDLIYKNSLDIISGNEKSIFIGGDHSKSFSIGKAFIDVCRREGHEPFLIVFDAHADCCKYTNGHPNNIQWLRALIDNNFPKDKVILIGLRSYSEDEISYLGENMIRRYEMKDMLDIQEICDIVMELSRKFYIYLSIDIDVVDSAFVPGTFRRESGGMTSRQLIYFVQRLNLLKNLRVIDLSEINPDLENDVTVSLGAKIVTEFI
ncbi:MAG: arginase family protein [Candidatus Pacearchaeota archaeon]